LLIKAPARQYGRLLTAAGGTAPLRTNRQHPQRNRQNGQLGTPAARPESNRFRAEALDRFAELSGKWEKQYPAVRQSTDVPATWTVPHRSQLRGSTRRARSSRSAALECVSPRPINPASI
jgi:hypothetical protein